MPLPLFRALVRHPAAVALRPLLWPTVILVLSNLTADAEDDALAAGLEAFVVVVALAFFLSLADGLVLRGRALVLVWSISTVVLAALLSSNNLIDHLLHGGDGTTTTAYEVHATLVELPLSMLFFLVMVGVPVVLGSVTGATLRYGFAMHPRGGDRAPGAPAPH